LRRALRKRKQRFPSWARQAGVTRRPAGKVLAKRFHFNTSVFRELLLRYKNTGQDVYFDIQITNEDPTSEVGRQTIILKDCNMDEGLLKV